MREVCVVCPRFVKASALCLAVRLNGTVLDSHRGLSPPLEVIKIIRTVFVSSSPEPLYAESHMSDLHAPLHPIPLVCQ